MSVDTAIAHFRAKEAELMARGEGQLRRPDGNRSLNPDTGVLTPSAPVVYAGAGYVRPATLRDQDATTGDDNVRLEYYILKLPVDTDVRKSDVWAQAVSRDVGMVGRDFRVVEAKLDEFEITRRCLLEEIVR